jgi:hypothetical protein
MPAGLLVVHAGATELASSDFVTAGWLQLLAPVAR